MAIPIVVGFKTNPHNAAKASITQEDLTVVDLQGETALWAWP